jgi:hypothetical protein
MDHPFGRRHVRRAWTVYPSRVAFTLGSIALTAALVVCVRESQRPSEKTEPGPVSVFLSADRDWDGPTGRKLIRHLSRALGYLKNVAEVRSLTQPLGRPLSEPTTGAHGLFGSLQWTGPDDGFVNPYRLAREQFLPVRGDRRMARLDVILQSDPVSPESSETLAAADALLATILRTESGSIEPVRWELAGPAVHVRDRETALAETRKRAVVFAAIGLALMMLALALQLFREQEKPETAPPYILRMPLPSRIRPA